MIFYSKHSKQRMRKRQINRKHIHKTKSEPTCKKRINNTTLLLTKVFADDKILCIVLKNSRRAGKTNKRLMTTYWKDMRDIKNLQYEQLNKDF